MGHHKSKHAAPKEASFDATLSSTSEAAIRERFADLAEGEKVLTRKDFVSHFASFCVIASVFQKKFQRVKYILKIKF